MEIENQPVERVSPNVGETKRVKFLVVEDDYSIQPFWEQIIHAVAPNAVIRWAISEEGAEKQIRDRIKVDDQFDVVIADILLAGERNGVDLWKRYGDDSLFVFTSGIRPVQFEKMIGERSVDMPTFLKKPLDPGECIESLRALLAFGRTFS